MSAHTRKHHIKHNNHDVIKIRHAGILYIFPKAITEKYRVSEVKNKIPAEEVFADINKEYTKPGALLRGIRIRENLTQIQMAKKIRVTQSDISQMENGIRNIGKIIAKRIEKLFGINYRSFLI